MEGDHAHQIEGKIMTTVAVQNVGTEMKITAMPRPA